MKKRLVLLIRLVLTMVILVSCDNSPVSPTLQMPEPTRQAILEPIEQATPEPTEQTTPKPTEQTAFAPTEPVKPEPTDPPNAAASFSDIPYYGEREKCRLPAEHAMAYAEAVRDAEFIDEYWGRFHFDTIYPVLIDVSGDGVPLLLLAEKDNEYGWDTYWNILFGYSNGALQRITDYPIGIGIASEEHENWLSLMNDSDFGSQLYFYRVNYGAAELISYSNFFDNWHEGTFYIDDAEVSEDEFRAELSKIPIEYFMGTNHPGNVHSLPSFEEYLLQPFTSDKVVQIFQDYADALEER